MIARSLPFLVSRLLVAAGCLLASVLCAQPTPPPKPANLRFLFIDETPGAYALKIGSDFRQISSAPYIISAPYTPASLRPIELFKTGTTPDPRTGELPRDKVASFTPPANTTSALVIITPRPAAPGAAVNYDVEVIDSAPGAFPGGAIRILNRGHTTLAVQFSTEQIITEPGGVKLLQPATDDRGRIRARVAVQTPEKWKLISDNVAVVKPTTRLTGVLVYSPSGMKFRFNKSILAERGDPPPSHVWLTYTDTP